MITIVSGLPRSRTSLMMQMLQAGGGRVALLTDEVRSRDEDNPRGYFEYEPVKRLQRDASWMAAAKGKAVKVVAPLLFYLPADYTYKVIFMLQKRGAGLPEE